MLDLGVDLFGSTDGTIFLCKESGSVESKTTLTSMVCGIYDVGPFGAYDLETVSLFSVLTMIPN